MAKRYPLVYDEVNDIIQQLPVGDYIDAGLDGIEVVASVALAKPEAVSFYDNTGVLTGRKAIADVATFYKCHGFASENIGATATGVVQIENKLVGFTGLVPGDDYYLSATTAGAVTNDLNTFGSGDYVQKVGYAVSATELYIDIKEPIQLR